MTTQPAPRPAGCDVHVLGIRHHGPGSARAVAAALDEVRPTAVLIEGAPELDVVAALAAAPTMAPPVAGLVYVPDEPRRASFWPMASFSPEWVALRWALRQGAVVHFADLPAATQLAAGASVSSSGADVDPLATLAEAAGFDDAERWWEDAVEHRRRGLAAFEAVTDAMGELRADPAFGGRVDERTERREASMRTALRAAMRSHERVVFVCGAWHAPALLPATFPSASADAKLLRGLPKVKVAATWVPWTNGRLSFRSGYGAGVSSPGWYEHLFEAPDDVPVRWLTRTAQLLRAEQLDASPAQVVEAVRLAEALAALRERPIPGLAELTDATRATLCGGSDVPLQIVSEKLFVGDRIGAVPAETPMVPLARDLERQQRRLRLKPRASVQLVTLDLRTGTHLERSNLLHRLAILGVPWGEQVEAGRTRGTFKEAWALEWHPELSVALIDASGSGNTIAEAAVARLVDRSTGADIAQLTSIVERALLADLPEALAAGMAALAARSARQHDTLRLMAAVEPLARLSRYGNVRRVDTEAVAGVLHGIALRIAIGLGSAVSSLDDDAAASVRDLVDGVQRGLAMADAVEEREAWYGALAGVADQEGVHGLVAGRAVRLLLDAARIDRDDAARRLSRQLSRAADAAAGAAWLDGFLAGDATLLIHDDELLDVVDDWIGDVPPDRFEDVLPLVRRTFSAFAQPERRKIGEAVARARSRRGSAGSPLQRADDGVDVERARRSLPVLQLILGGGT